MARLGLKDVAKALGVSESTVSLALNNRPNVKPETRKRVLEYVEQVGYAPHPMARGLAIQKTMTIGVVCPDTENPYYGSLINHITDACEQYGYSLLLSLSGDDPKREATILRSFIDRQVDGVVIMPINAAENAHVDLNRFTEANIPFVFSTSCYSGYDDDCVRGDYYRGAYGLTRWMLEHGHRSLWYLVTEDQRVPVAAERLRGYRDAFADLRLPHDENWVVGCREISGESGARVATALLAERDAPDGILALNDYMAFGVVRAIRALGLKVPQDISVAGYDDVPFAEIAGVPLTTVRQNLDLIAIRSVERLMDKILGEPQPPKSELLIAPTLVIRETTRHHSLDLSEDRL